MRTRMVTVAICFLLSANMAYADISDVESYANECYSFLRRAYSERDLDDAQDYARKAMYAAQSAASEAEDLGLDDAAGSFEDAYNYARRARNENNIDGLQTLVRRAMRSCEEGQSELRYGN